MKILGILLSAVLLFSACQTGANKEVKNQLHADGVEILYFHAKKRCPTCNAIEKNTRAVLETRFAEALKAGTLTYKVVDISTPDGERLADQYEVTWSSLYLNCWSNQKETRQNLTEFAFATARRNPQNFQDSLHYLITQLLP